MTIRVEATQFDGRRAATSVVVGSDRFPVALAARTPLRTPAAFGDVWLPLAIFPAMRTGTPLELADPVSGRLLETVVTAQEVLATWFPELTPVPVTARRARRRPGRRRVHTGQLFTAGVDSFYTLHRRPEVRTLVYVHDDVHDTDAVRERISPLLRSAASAEGRTLVELDSDVRTMLDLFGEWGTQTHGAALAAVAALLSGTITRMLLPASHTYLELYPWGSHPVLDPLWSGDRHTVEHDSADRSRTQKIAALADDDTALAHLRVCWEAVDDVNCSRCEKCLRTMTALETLGVLDRARTFAGPLDLEAVRRVELGNDSDLSFSLDNLSAARAAGRTDLADATEASVARYRAHAG